MNNINPETKTGVQAKSKAAKSLAKSYLYQGWVTAALETKMTQQTKQLEPLSPLILYSL